MSATQTIREEIADALSACDAYNQNNKRWQFLFESYLGGEDYRRAQHLTRYQLETDGEYAARLRATPLENHCQSVISIYTSFLFRKPPSREYGSISNLPEVDAFLEDADLDGRNLDSFMKEVAVWASVFGHTWIMVSKPNVGAETMADEAAMGVRPYVSLLTPLVVTDWVWQRQANGRYELSYLKYVEDVNGDSKTIVEWTKETIRKRTVNERAETIEEDTVEVNGLGIIPAVIAYNARSTVRGMGISAINDIADIQKFIYNSTSEVATSIALDSHPSLVTTQETNVGTGAGAVIRLPENLDPALKPYVLDFAGANISNIYQSIEHSTAVIDKMASLGAVRATETTTMSGVALQTEFEMLNARLSEVADNLELAEEQVWRLFCQYQGQPYDMEIKYPDSFNIRDNNRELAELQVAANVSTDPRIKAAIDARVLDILELDEDEVTAMNNPLLVDLESVPEEEDKTNYKPKNMVNTVTAEVRTAQSPEEQLELAKAGWVAED